MIDDVEVQSAHLNFFARNQSGCAFAAHAARDHARLEWEIAVVRLNQINDVGALIEAQVANPQVSTLSIIFPDISTPEQLDDLIPNLNQDAIHLHETFDTNQNRCYRFRIWVGDEESYVSGFAAFDTMPVTRQAPHVSIVMRVAPRPVYDWYLKKPDPGLVHVADMDMKGLNDRQLHRMWGNSFFRTAGLLGHKPDDESAAKTTFVIPLDRAMKILL